MNRLVYTFSVDEGAEIRVYLRQYKGQPLIEFRRFEQDPQTQKWIGTAQGLVLPLHALEHLQKAVSKLAEAQKSLEPLRKEEKAPEFAYFCSECNEPLREVSTGVYECACGESRLICLPIKHAVEQLFEKIKEERFFEDYAGG